MRRNLPGWALQQQLVESRQLQLLQEELWGPKLRRVSMVVVVVTVCMVGSVGQP